MFKDINSDFLSVSESRTGILKKEFNNRAGILKKKINIVLKYVNEFSLVRFQVLTLQILT
jgi:hypothetical protein